MLARFVLIADQDLELGRIFVQSVHSSNYITEEVRRPPGSIWKPIVGLAKRECIGIQFRHDLLEPIRHQPVPAQATFQILRRRPLVGPIDQPRNLGKWRETASLRSKNKTWGRQQGLLILKDYTVPLTASTGIRLQDEELAGLRLILCDGFREGLLSIRRRALCAREG